MQALLETILRGAGRMILESDKSTTRQKEGHANFVTDTDVAVQSFLKEKLAALREDAQFFAEEQENAALTDAPTWVVDPVDGTLNFIHHRRWSCISVALLENKKPTFGAVFNPYAGELFTAEKGRGAFCNGVPIHVSQTPLSRAVVSFGTSPYNAELAEKGMAAALAFLKQAADLRRLGAAALDLCDLAAGRSDVFFELSLSPWDFAAGALIVSEAGGRLLAPFRLDIDFGRPTALLCSNVPCFEPARTTLLEALKQ